MKPPVALGIASLVFAASLHAQIRGVREFKVDDAWGRDAVQFRATAPMEEIVGTTDEIVGMVRVDPGAVRSPRTRRDSTSI